MQQLVANLSIGSKAMCIDTKEAKVSAFKEAPIRAWFVAHKGALLMLWESGHIMLFALNVEAFNVLPLSYCTRALDASTFQNKCIIWVNLSVVQQMTCINITL